MFSFTISMFHFFRRVLCQLGVLIQSVSAAAAAFFETAGAVKYGRGSAGAPPESLPLQSSVREVAGPVPQRRRKRH